MGGVSVQRGVAIVPGDRPARSARSSEPLPHEPAVAVPGANCGALALRVAWAWAVLKPADSRQDSEGGKGASFLISWAGGRERGRKFVATEGPCFGRH